MNAYILHSERLGKFYVGIATSPEKRLKQHNSGHSRWSRRADDWRIVYRKAFDSVAQAREHEQKIKARGAARFLQDLARHG